VPLPAEARDVVAGIVTAVQEDLDAALGEPRSRVRWVRTDGLHLTLRFLGPTDPSRVDAVAGAVRRAAERSEPFVVRVNGAGAFPTPARPRAIWLGVVDAEERLAALAGLVNEELDREGWPPDDRPYRAHLTLARSDGRREGPLAARWLRDRAEGLDLGVPIDRVLLYRSVTGGGPARYEPLAEAALGPEGGRATAEPGPAV
jgi:RNA 2',3'-cyclic 3'-phosphodiesterase